MKSILIKDIQELPVLFEGKTLFAFDTETTGLDYTRDRIVGYSFSFDGKVGYYVPLRHMVDPEQNLDPKEALTFIVEKIKTSRVLMFNKKFDLNMLQIAEGFDLHYSYNVLDVQAYVWLKDTDEGFPSLKKSAKEILKVDTVEFSDVVQIGDFSSLSPKEAVHYASQDAVLTYQLFVWCIAELHEDQKIFKLDSDAAECFRMMEMNEIPIDRKWVEEEANRCLTQIGQLTQEIYQLVGYNFKIASNRDKAAALQQVGIVLTDKTAGGNFAVRLEILEKIDHPLAKKMVQLSRLEKYYGSYIKKLQYMGDAPARFNYFLCKVPCLTSDAVLHTKNKGFVSISEVSVGDLVFTGQGYNKVLATTVTHNTKVVRVVFRDGNELTGTPHHPVLLKNQTWCTLSHLKEGDFVVKSDPGAFEQRLIPDELCEIMGRLRHYKVCLSEKSVSFRVGSKNKHKLEDDLKKLSNHFEVFPHLSEWFGEVVFKFTDMELVEFLRKGEFFTDRVQIGRAHV